MGPYVINDLSLLDSLPGSDAVIPASDAAYGVQCVGLVKQYSKAGGLSTRSWSAGASVMATPTLARGTAIATFDDKGHYPSHARGNHACFLIGFVAGGIKVLEQHVSPNPDKIQTRTIRARGTEAGDPSNNADAYSVIL